MARPEKTEPVFVCVDADVLIAGLLSRTGASHAILVLGELGLLRLVLPEAAVAEVRRNLASKLPEAAPLFEEFLRAVPVKIYRPAPQDHERAREPVKLSPAGHRCAAAPSPCPLPGGEREISAGT